MRRGATIVELLVVIFILAILVSLLLVAIFQSREATRRLTCSQNLRQVGLALQNYVSETNRFPNGNGDGFSFLVRLLPFIGEDARHRSINMKLAYEEQLNESWARTPRSYVCPSDPATSSASNLWSCNYLGIAGGSTSGTENGIIISRGGNSRHAVTAASITDGLSNTLAITEAGTYFKYGTGVESPTRSTATFKTYHSYAVPEELDAFKNECFSHGALLTSAYGLGTNWLEESIGVTRLNCIFPKQTRNCANAGSLTNALLAPNSLHTGGVYCALADGAVRLVSQEIDDTLWRSLATRNGGEVVQWLGPLAGD